MSWRSRIGYGQLSLTDSFYPGDVGRESIVQRLRAFPKHPREFQGNNCTTHLSKHRKIDFGRNNETAINQVEAVTLIQVAPYTKMYFRYLDGQRLTHPTLIEDASDDYPAC